MRSGLRVPIRWLLAAVLIGSVGNAPARLSQPDFVFYGTATWFGEPLPAGTEITLQLTSQGLTAAAYRLGDEEPLGGLYALRVPMDALEPRVRGTARPGDPATIHISGNLVAEVVIGDYGEAERLDIDPALLSGSNVSLGILGGSVVEGDTGTVPLEFTIDASMPAPAEIQVDWATEDGSATGGDACTAGVDYLNGSGVATIAAGETRTSIQVDVCGDFLIEPTENLIVRLSNPVNAVIQFATGTGQIVDEDGQPELSVRDLVVFEPAAGSEVASFEVRLSRPHDEPVSFDYQTSPGTATADVDYVSVSGSLVVPAGDTRAEIPVVFESDAEIEGPETMFLDISNAAAAVIVDPQGMAIILDEDSTRETDPRQQTPGIAGMISPTDIVFSPDGAHAYVSALVTGSVLRFDFGGGLLSVQQNIDQTTTGFETGRFGGIRQLALTPDGRFLYAAASGDDAVMGLARNAGDGSLALIEVMTSDAIAGLDGASGLAVSADGAHLYVTGHAANTLVVFAIAPAGGQLTLVETETHGADDPLDAGGAVSRMDGPLRVAVAPDGNHVYVAAERSSGIVVFDRNPATGALSFKVSYQNAVDGVTGIGGASALALPADGRHLYVLGAATDSIARFDRLGDGTLSFREQYLQANGDFVGLKNPVDLHFNGGGSRLYAVGIDDSSLVTMRRQTNDQSPDFGRLGFGEVVMDESGGITDMAGPTSVAVAPSGQHIAVTAGIDNAIVVFQTEVVFISGFE